MVRARAASRIGANIPFGAAHRVYFDTPPLVGRCPAPVGARWRCAGLKRVAKFAAPVGATGRYLALKAFRESPR